MRAAALLGLLALACGTNRPDIPDELLNLDGGTGGGAANYPAGPYGTEVGSVVADVTFFQGWTNPRAANYDPTALAPIAFSDFHDPDGETYEILLVNTSAIWCSACKIEHGGTGQSPSLNDHHAELSPKGFVILSTLFEDATKQPADVANLVTWTQTFETEFPMALDPEYQMGAFQPDKGLAPYNLVIDARTMTILNAYVGDQAAVMWPFIEAELDARAAGG